MTSDELLALAAESADVDKYKQAIKSGANVNTIHPDGNTCLHKAILNASEHTTPYQDWNEEKCFDAVRMGYDHDGLLEQARRLYTIRLLIEAGADQSIKNPQGESAADLAARLGRTAFADFLLDA